MLPWRHTDGSLYGIELSRLQHGPTDPKRLAFGVSAIGGIADGHGPQIFARSTSERLIKLGPQSEEAK
jgi:hypothetical protein